MNTKIRKELVLFAILLVLAVSTFFFNAYVQDLRNTAFEDAIRLVLPHNLF